MHTFVASPKSFSHCYNLITAFGDLLNGFNFELFGITFSTHNTPHFYLLLYSYEMSTKAGSQLYKIILTIINIETLPHQDFLLFLFIQMKAVSWFRVKFKIHSQSI